MGKNEITEKVIGEVAKVDAKSAKAMEDRLVTDSLRKFLTGKVDTADGKKAELMDVITEKVLKKLLDDPNMADLERLYNMLEKSEKTKEKVNVNVRVNKTDEKLAELAKGKR